MIRPRPNTTDPQSALSSINVCARSPWRWSAWAVICAYCALSGTAWAQSARGPAPPLARFVPADAGLFVEVDNLLQLGDRLKQHDLWHTVEPLIGDTQGGWTKALADSLGVESTLSMARMFREEVALAAPDWRRLGEGIVVFTQSSPRVLHSIIDRRRAKAMLTVGPVQIYRTRGGLWLAVRQSTIVVAQKRGEGSYFDRSVDLLSGRAGDALFAEDVFRKAFLQLPAPRLASAYWRLPENAENAGDLAPWWPRMQHGALVVISDGDAFEVVFQGIASEKRNPTYRPRVLLDRLSGLPQTTLAAWATSVDVRALYESLRDSELPRLRDLAHAFGDEGDARRFEAEVITRLGPRCLVCLGADLGADALDPQLGIAIESVDARGVVETLHEMAEQFAQATGENGEHRQFELATETHLGVPIHQLRWQRNDQPLGETLGALVTQTMSPCFAAQEDWVLFSTSPNHLREIIEARIGVTNRLEPSVRLADQEDQLDHAISVAVMQPSFMQGMLRYWDSVLDERRRMRQALLRLGADWDDQRTAGQVRIRSINSNGLSAGVLQPDDAIVACAGALLSMSDAPADLQRKLAKAPLDQPTLLRVLRGDEMLDVTLPPLPDSASAEPTALEGLAGKLTPFERLAAQTSAATFSIDRDRGDGFQARAWLLLKPPPSTPAEAPPE